MTKINFFGTDNFGAGILKALIASNNFEIATVFAMPDKPAGRKQEIKLSAVKTLAENNNLTVVTPETFKDFNFSKFPAELNVVCDYGIIIPKKVLNAPTHGSINIHPSLLPRYRGATPIETALINGDSQTGVSIILMDEKMDHGALLTQEKLQIDQNDNYLTLAAKLNTLAGQMIVKLIPQLVKQEIVPVPQNEELVSFCYPLTRDSGKINWQDSAQKIYNQFRGTIPWPGVWTTWDNKRLKILNIIGVNEHETLAPGLVKFTNDQILIGTGQGVVKIAELQLEGKKTMTASEFMNGYKKIAGEKLI